MSMSGNPSVYKTSGSVIDTNTHRTHFDVSHNEKQCNSNNSIQQQAAGYELNTEAFWQKAAAGICFTSRLLYQ